ncbi:hypothetical protein LCGC14_2821690, partial [marine sediment metagenome]
IKIRFQSASTTTNFDMELDQIALDYANSTISFDTRGLSIYDTFSQGSGTIEFWGYFYDSPYVNQILFNNNTQIFHNGSFYWRYDSTDVLMVSGLFGQWVHFEIIWSGNDVDVYVNGTKEIDTFWSDSDTTLTRIDFMSFDNSSFYVDAVGFSWDSDYDVGDNINSHGKAVITALENEGWIVAEEPFTSIAISGEFNSHKKILNLTDYSTINDIEVYNTFSDQTTGTIEFYWKTTDITDYSWFNLRSGTTVGPNLAIIASEYKYFDGAYQGTGVIPINNVWDHHKIEFDTTTDTFDWYINDILIVDNGDFQNVLVSVDNIFIHTYTGDDDYSVYFDAISYSWDEPTSYFAGSYNQHANIEAVIDFVIDIPFDYYERDILRLIAESRHYTNIFANISFNLYNFNS